MPEQTFLNLSEERQKEIIDISLKEFSFHNFETASINKIINEIGVAKGSFYRYFKTKKDLYLFLLDYAMNKKIDYLEKNIDTTTTSDFFEIYRSTVFNYMKFDLTFPTISKFLRTAVDNKYIEQSQVLNSLHGKPFIKNLISKGQREGQIKQSLDVDFVILCIINLSEALLNYINLKLGLNYKELLEVMEGEASDSKTELQNIFAQLMEVLKTGLKPAEA
ncbi:TetR/AcrR family transcriptional regulator [Clostridium sp. ZS2-4]|uniref:TetR/AcrR family transcriptional regulator n=1 Tax=Clostridium sp. ZS2-4 TaxID=2987703 RepID=UPI00227C561B|nr:TetR/AcrR family transcriptional regulator [Clostridium sp. ZS2-4]MCY6355120.1 TetR/AcrR family transcriptional regulator [Clostridium sp. ZS2-4]